MTTAAHPLRCETCNYHILQKMMKHPHVCDHPMLTEDEENEFSFIPNEKYRRIVLFGCASHSGAGSVDAVLDDRAIEMLKWIDKNKILDQGSCEGRALQEIIAELRQQKERER